MAKKEAARRQLLQHYEKFYDHGKTELPTFAGVECNPLFYGFSTAYSFQKSCQIL